MHTDTVLSATATRPLTRTCTQTHVYETEGEGEPGQGLDPALQVAEQWSAWIPNY